MDDLFLWEKETLQNAKTELCRMEAWEIEDILCKDWAEKGWVYAD